METQSEVLGDGPRFVSDAPPFVSMAAPGKWVNKLGLAFSAGKDWSPANYLTFSRRRDCFGEISSRFIGRHLDNGISAQFDR